MDAFALCQHQQIMTIVECLECSVQSVAVRSDQKGQCQLGNLDWFSVDVLSHSRIQMNCIFSTKFSQSHSVEGTPKKFG